VLLLLGREQLQLLVSNFFSRWSVQIGGVAALIDMNCQ